MTVNPAEDTTSKNLPQEQTVPDPIVEQVATDVPPPDDEKEKNWRAFREARKLDRAKTEAAEKLAREKAAEAEALKAAMEAAFGRQNESVHRRADIKNNDYAYEPEESEDERIEKKVQAALAAREQAYQQQQQEREQREYPQKLARTYSDFNQTVSTENLDYLEFHYPEVANPLKRLADGYDKWADIYKAVKKFVPNSVTSRQEAARADANFNKPKSMSAASIASPGDAGNAARLSEEKKAENWARMQRLLKGVS